MTGPVCGACEGHDPHCPACVSPFDWAAQADGGRDECVGPFTAVDEAIELVAEVWHTTGVTWALVMDVCHDLREGHVWLPTTHKEAILLLMESAPKVEVDAA